MNRPLCFALAGLLFVSPAWANFDVTTGSGTHVFAIDAANQGASLCAATSTECPASVLVDTSGAPFGTTGNHLFATVSGAVGATLNTTPSLANGNGVVPTQGGAVLSATNGVFTNILVGNVAESATNGIFANQLQGNAALSVSNPAFTALSDSTTKVGVDATSTGLKVFIAGGASGVVNPNGAAAPGSSSPVVSPTMTHASTTALGTSLVAKASAGNLGAYNCTGIAGAAAGYCIVYNGTTAPSTGALTGANVLDFCSFDTTSKGCSLTRLPNSIAYSTGIVVLISSAASPYTYTTGTDTGAIEADYF